MSLKLMYITNRPDIAQIAESAGVDRIFVDMEYPKACQYAATEDYDGMRCNMEKSLVVSSLIGFAAGFGLWAIADQFALLYYGDEFAVCGGIISAMCPLILISGLGESVRSQFIYPLKMDTTMVKVVSLNAIVNLLLSAALIPSLGVYGAIIGSIAAELNGMIIEVLLCRKYISIKWFVMQFIPYAAIGAIMFVVVKTVSVVTGNGWGSLGLQVLVGAIVYCLLAVLYMYFFKTDMFEIGIKEIKGKIKRN